MASAPVNKRTAYWRKWNAENKERAAATKRAWNEKNKEKVAADKKAWYNANRDKHRDGALRARYGISLAQHDEMLEAQGGACAICGAPEPSGVGTWHVDHNHESGAVRGLLCAHCNVGLGMFKENSDTLRRAVAYLAAAKGQPGG